MSLENAPRDTMIKSAPDKKGGAPLREFFFAPLDSHPAETVYASTIEEATAECAKRRGKPDLQEPSE